MFTPRFDFISPPNYRNAADIINRPHEDYPNRVDVTAAAIKYYAYGFAYRGPLTSEVTIKEIHSKIMSDTPHAGTYRTCQVMIGANDRGMDYWDIPAAMSRIDVVLDNEMIMREWYKAFQQIHPFEDGNGRVGGVVIAAASLVYFGDRIMVPLQ